MNKPFNYIISFFSFELLFVLFLNAGRYKGDPRFAWVPVDLTALFLVLSIAAGVYILFYKDLSFRIPSAKLNFIYFIFAGYVFLSFLWTPGEIYAKEKAIYIATLVFWPLIATSIIITASKDRFKRFLILFLLFSLWIAGETFIAYQQAARGTLSVLGGNYLGVGRVIGPVVLIILGYTLYFVRTITAKILGLVLIGLLLYLLFVTGGRGPLLATLIPVSIPFIASFRFESLSVIWAKKSFTLLLSVVIVGAMGMVYLMNQEDTPATLTRLELLLPGSDDVGGSAQARLSFYATAVEWWLKNPFIGYGVGSWPVLVEFKDARGYPHNIVLETLFEFGIIGLTILTSLFVYALRNLGSWSKIRTNPYRMIILMIFANALFNAFVSGDIPDNRFLFASLGLMMLQDSQGEDSKRLN